jgi:hypothetical protein
MLRPFVPGRFDPGPGVRLRAVSGAGTERGTGVPTAKSRVGTPVCRIRSGLPGRVRHPPPSRPARSAGRWPSMPGSRRRGPLPTVRIG